MGHKTCNIHIDSNPLKYHSLNRAERKIARFESLSMGRSKNGKVKRMKTQKIYMPWHSILPKRVDSKVNAIKIMESNHTKKKIIQSHAAVLPQEHKCYRIIMSFCEFMSRLWSTAIWRNTFTIQAAVVALSARERKAPSVCSLIRLSAPPNSFFVII